MLLKNVVAVVFALIPSLASAAEPSSPRTAIQESHQIIRVLVPDWNSVQGTLQRFERDAAGNWNTVGNAIPVVVGKHGLGWGRGLHGEAAANGEPVKHEGDGKAPAGIFRFGTSFGYDATTINAKNFPYIQATDTLNCVDDVQSPYYNQLVDEKSVSKTWTSSEIMKRSDELYRYGFVIEHNTSPALPGAGSCIFMHIWRASDQGTAGCTAMAESDLTQVFSWIDPNAQPLLVQLTNATYTQKQTEWALP